MLQIKLMGSFSASLIAGERVRVLSLSRRTAELLAILALTRGRALHRAELGQLLTVGGTADVTPEAVSTALWRLRRALDGPYVVANSYGALKISDSVAVSVDVALFEELASSGLHEPSRFPGEAQISPLRAATGLYKGCLLPGFSAEWVVRERERLRRTYLEVLYRLVEIDATRGDFAGAIHHAQLILESDEMREDVHRALMGYYVSNGQRALALRQFEICRDALKRHLAIQPMRETMQLYRKISDGAAGRVGLRETSANSQYTPQIDVQGRRSPVSSLTRASNDAAAHLAAARSLIAQADSHLHESIDLIEP